MHGMVERSRVGEGEWERLSVPHVECEHFSQNIYFNGALRPQKPHSLAETMRRGGGGGVGEGVREGGENGGAWRGGGRGMRSK